MDEMVYNALCRYFNALERLGYMSFDNAEKLLILIFLKDFVFNDYRCTISRDDYHLIERALNCLYGTTCLIPYPDYLKMGKLRLGDMTELACRVKTLENTNVVKVIHDLDSVTNKNDASDIIIMSDGEPASTNNSNGTSYTDSTHTNTGQNQYNGGTPTTHPESSSGSLTI